MAKSDNHNFLIQGSILGIASILVRIIGVLYRAPLTGIIGDLGNGYYSSAYNIYAMILLISSFSIPLAVSRIISARLAKQEYRNANRIFKGALIYAVIVGGVAAAFAYVFAPYIIPDEMSRGVTALRVLSPTIFLSAILGVFRGYFQGRNTMVPTSISQIFEQIINAVGSVGAAFLLTRTVITAGAEAVAQRGAAGGAVGTGLGVAAGLVYMLYCYNRHRKREMTYIQNDKTETIESYRSILKIIFTTVTPVIFSSFIFNVNSTVDQYLYAMIMGWKGFGEELITTWYGIYSVKYTVMVGVPVAVAAAISTAVIPSITVVYEQKRMQDTYQKIDMTMKFSMLIAIPAAVGMSVLSKPILSLLFSGELALASRLLTIGGITIVFTSLSTVTNAILQGLGQLKAPVHNAVLSLLLHCIALIAMLYFTSWNLYSMIAATLVFGVAMCWLNQRALYRFIGHRMKIKETMVLPAIASAFMGVAAYFSYALWHKVVASNVICLAIAIVIAVVVYGIFLLLSGAITKEELTVFPMGNHLCRVAQKLRLLK
ncbi:MAG: oligosaccharide flippase family protein [Lachnospiraceae bacterium]